MDATQTRPRHWAERSATRGTVICAHASGSSGNQWRALRARLEPEFEVLTPDLHGHGAGPGWHGFDEDIVAADASRIAQLARSCAGEIHLVGHSYGGAIALRVALYHPEIITSVSVYEPVVFRLLFDCYGSRPPAAEVQDVAAGVRRCVQANDLQGAARVFVDYWNERGAFARLAPDQQEHIARRMPVICAHFIALAGDAARLADYRSLAAPVLLLGGRLMHAPVQRLRDLLDFALPDVTTDTLPGMGHMGPVTHADAVAARIERFIAGHRFPVAPAEHRRVA